MNQTYIRRSLIALSLVFLLSLNIGPTPAQSGGSYRITNSVIAAGGGESKDVTNNRFEHESTVGEHAA
jgi:hypothetical protein